MWPKIFRNSFSEANTKLVVDLQRKFDSKGKKKDCYLCGKQIRIAA